MFALPFVMVPLVFMFVIGMFVYTFSQTIKEKKKNEIRKFVENDERL